MPALGVAQQTGTLLKWLKAEGQSISKGEPLMEIETDKATVEIEAPASGILSQVIAKVGDEVPVGQRIALILARRRRSNRLCTRRWPTQQDRLRRHPQRVQRCGQLMGFRWVAASSLRLRPRELPEKTALTWKASMAAAQRAVF